MKPDEARQIVKSRYDQSAQKSIGKTSCRCPSVSTPAAGFAAMHGLYSKDELSSVPETSFTLSKGCGNPTGFAHLRTGETVVDFGCGAGIDVILAARRVSLGGKVVGVDMTPHMIERAKQAVAEAGLTAVVDFQLCELERLELPDDFADVVISNCVINLCPDKAAVYREAFRILKPGGRLAISDIVYTESPDPALKARFESTWAGCVGGAIEEDGYFQIVMDAGFGEIRVVATHPLAPKELEEMATCPGPEFTPAPAAEDLSAVQGKVASIKFTAVKPFHRQ